MLKPFYEDSNEIPEGFGDHYTEKDGKFILEVESVNGYALENVSGLKSALQNERNTQGQLKSQLSEFESKLSAFQSQTDKLNQEKTNKEGSLEQLQNKLNEMVKVGEKRDSELSNMKIDNVVNKALQGVQLMPSGHELLAPHIRSQVRLVDGQVKVVDPSTGVVKLTANGGDISDMSVVELIEDMKSKYAIAFKGSDATGSGSKTAGGTSMSQQKFSEMSLDDKSKLYNENPSLYEKLKSQN